MSITPQTVLARSDDILYAAGGDDEAVMTSVEAGRCHGLSAVASRVWEPPGIAPGAPMGGVLFPRAWPRLG